MYCCACRAPRRRGNSSGSAAPSPSAVQPVACASFGAAFMSGGVRKSRAAPRAFSRLCGRPLRSRYCYLVPPRRPWRAATALAPRRSIAVMPTTMASATPKRNCGPGCLLKSRSSRAVGRGSSRRRRSADGRAKRRDPRLAAGTGPDLVSGLSRSSCQTGRHHLSFAPILRLNGETNLAAYDRAVAKLRSVGSVPVMAASGFAVVLNDLKVAVV